MEYNKTIYKGDDLRKIMQRENVKEKAIKGLLGLLRMLPYTNTYASFHIGMSNKEYS